MNHEPQIRERAAQDYAGIRMTVPMDGISGAVDEAFPELFGWLAGQGIAPAGPPFIRYLVIDMAAELQLELADPLALVLGPGSHLFLERLDLGLHFCVFIPLEHYQRLCDRN